MLCEKGENQNLRCCLWPRWDPTRPKQSLSAETNVSNEDTLTNFDPEKEITLQVNASLKGLGAALIQENKPVETRYANIERALLVFKYGCEKFHTYLLGHSFTVFSDHKPLESIHL